MKPRLLILLSMLAVMFAAPAMAQTPAAAGRMTQPA